MRCALLVAILGLPKEKFVIEIVVVRMSIWKIAFVECYKQDGAVFEDNDSGPFARALKWSYVAEVGDLWSRICLTKLEVGIDETLLFGLSNTSSVISVTP